MEVVLDPVTADLVQEIAIQLAVPPARVREIALELGIQQILWKQLKRS